jgi:hypothetical protein
LRAAQQIGELSRELETAQGARTELHFNDETKSIQLQKAGIDTVTVHRYEQLSGPREEQAMHICAAATDAFSRLRQNQRPFKF